MRERVVKMRNVKANLVLVLALVFALVLAGCGKAPQGGAYTPADAAAETEAAEENPLRLGSMEGGTYTNAYAGFACDLDETWLYHGAEDLQDMPAEAMEAMDGSELGKYMDKVSQLSDMMAENQSMMSTVNVLYTKQDPASRLLFKALNEEQVLDVVLEQKDMLMEAYTQAGINASSIEKVKVHFLGEEHWGAKTVAETQGVPYYVLQVFNYKAGDYGVTLTAASFVEDRTQEVLDLFYAAE